MSLLRYLAYGSNLHPERLRRRVPSARLEDRVCLTGWRLTFHKRGYDGSGKGHIIETGDAEDRVWCAVFSLPARERGPLDEAEAGYGVTELILPDGSRAFTYLALPERVDPQTLPYDWYRDLIAAGARYLQVPETYVRAIEAHGAIPDPHSDRARDNRQLLVDLAGMPGWKGPAV